MLLKSNHSVSFSEMLNRILQEALKREGLENESDSGEQSMSMNQNQPKENAIMNTVQRKRQTKGTNVEIESKLNSLYNRLV